MPEKAFSDYLRAATDAELVVSAQDGSLDSFSCLVERHSAMAYQVALSVTGDHGEAQDVAQESLLAAWRGLHSFRGEADFGTWLHTIVRRRALTAVKSARPTGKLPADMPDQALGPQAAAELSSELDAVVDAVRALPEPQRLAIQLHLQGQPYTSIAAQSGATVPAVAAHLLRGRRTLRRALQAWR